MYLGLFFTIAALWGSASSHPEVFPLKESPLELALDLVGNSKVKAILSNTGTSDLKLLKTGTLLDSAPVEKVKVFNDSACKNL